MIHINHVKSITQAQADMIYRRLPGRSKLIFALGLETGLRISDMLSLKIQDIENPMRVYVGRIDRVASYPISEWLYGELYDLRERYPDDRYIFPGRKRKRPLHRTTVHRDIKRAVWGMAFTCSAHSTRKLFLTLLSGR